MTALYGLFAIHLHPNGKATQCRYGWRIPQYSLKNGFMPVRKPGKLPQEEISQHYTPEYDTNCLEIHKKDLPAGRCVLIVDDVLATGGTARAVAQGVKAQGAHVIELAFLGRAF